MTTTTTRRLSASETLRLAAPRLTPSTIANHGGGRNFHVGRLYLAPEGSPSEGFARYEWGSAEWEARRHGEPRSFDECRALLNRWRAFKHYMEETRHGWTAEREIHYADNSTVLVERSKLTGEERTRMVSAPSGDACY